MANLRGAEAPRSPHPRKEGTDLDSTPTCSREPSRSRLLCQSADRPGVALAPAWQSCSQGPTKDVWVTPRHGADRKEGLIVPSWHGFPLRSPPGLIKVARPQLQPGLPVTPGATRERTSSHPCSRGHRCPPWSIPVPVASELRVL